MASRRTETFPSGSSVKTGRRSPNTIPAATPCHKWRVMVHEILGSRALSGLALVSLERITQLVCHSATAFIPPHFQKGNSNRVITTAATTPAKAAPKRLDEAKSLRAEGARIK